jgi:hypothetical protein
MVAKKKCLHGCKKNKNSEQAAAAVKGMAGGSSSEREGRR